MSHFSKMQKDMSADFHEALSELIEHKGGIARVFNLELDGEDYEIMLTMSKSVEVMVQDNDFRLN